MNAKTAKLLRKWAVETSEKPRTVKREWRTLDRHERTARREVMKARLKQEE